MGIDIKLIAEQLDNQYGLKNANCVDLNTLANDVIEVITSNEHFALKLYNSASRTRPEVQWEVNLTRHLIEEGVPIAKPVTGKDGNYLQTFDVDSKERTAVLFEWAPGAKPKPELSTYTLIGKAAAQIHNAADTFKSDLPREIYNAHELFDDQLKRMEQPLEESGQWQRVFDLSERMRKIISNPGLDYGIIHNDLTLDNVHLDGDKLIVFDLDSAAESWRAAEPWGVLKAAEDRFEAWLKGYRSLRSFGEEDKEAVAAFVIIEDLRNVVWKLGYAKSSRGKPLMKTKDLPQVVDEWLKWEQNNVQKG